MYSVEELQAAVAASECWSDVCRKLNITICTFNYKRMQKLCRDNSIDYNHFDVKKTFRRNKKTWDADDIYTKNSLYPRSSLRQKVLKDDFMEYSCFQCQNVGEWLGSSLTLELEHVNGINDDNTKENLRWLCPNCHSQTPTYRCSTNRRGL